ncbi:hypothetical protein Goshw_010730, partial [Gossypium schwendimanii]|nr:hypothetical protein [Gossypium schwendimanii]
ESTGSSASPTISVDSPDVDLKFEDGDILKSTLNKILAIDFSERFKRILVNDMETIVIFKLLGCNIGYGVLYNQISSLWKPSQTFRLMDVENGYYLVRFQNKVDYGMALTQGPWIVFGHYFTVQPWMVDFMLGPLDIADSTSIPSHNENVSAST